MILAHHQNPRGLKETLAALLERVVEIYFHADTAANQKELPSYYVKGKTEQFGIIEFAIGIDVAAKFKYAVA